MTVKETTQVLEKLNLILEDFQMLRDGSWIPDEKSCNASIENIQDIINIIDYE